MRPFIKIILSFSLIALGFTSEARQKTWISTWAPALQIAEPHNTPPVALEGNSLLQILQVSKGGRELRVRISNIFNEEETVISGVEIACACSMGAVPDIKRGSLREVTFGGSGSLTVGAGESICSDPVRLRIRDRENLAVIIHFDKVSSSVITSHPGSRTTSYIAGGDTMDFSDAVRTDHWYFLSGIEVPAKRNSRLIAVLGDSITDGRGTTTNGQDRWTDVLSRRLLSEPVTRNVSVVNKGLGGNCILEGGLGPVGAVRYQRDLFDEPGVRYIILFEGVNDIGPSKDAMATVAGIEKTYREIVAKAHHDGIKVFGATIMPFEGNGYFSEEHEAARQDLNQWIRSYDGFDGVIDFDAVMRDPEHPSRLQEKYLFENDWLHVNASGYHDMGMSIDLNLFK